MGSEGGGWSPDNGHTHTMQAAASAKLAIFSHSLSREGSGAHPQTPLPSPYLCLSLSPPHISLDFSGRPAAVETLSSICSTLKTGDFQPLVDSEPSETSLNSSRLRGYETAGTIIFRTVGGGSLDFQGKYKTNKKSI